VLTVMLSYGLIGFYDDFLKVTKRNTKGFSTKARLGLELLIAAVAAYFILKTSGPALAGKMAVPFFKDMLVPLGVTLFVIMGVIVIAGSGNAVNFTDGLDGLAIVPVMIAAATFGIIAYLTGVMRGIGGRRAGLPLVQRPAGDDFYGRHGIACPWRSFGDDCGCN
jgi:phospho-N-acetylmuramoyl-pentapeptide-transferase